ncbi:hypothetical protein FHX52_0844 [Humibacillus xanthopallidus]|uniref:Uncharacterized protein n=1 Tax=Humibacillus xanthopallidus TaxID=412689 RepID=A0A543PUH6_9MICO|nr:hypothetical protein [Humibacillus xanthopallidus]TQN47729.1 hypothetical protein FHX52_0844 [Humibacillus xanthopallidus]
MTDDHGERRPAAAELGGHPAVDRARAAHHLVRTIGYQPERFARMRDEAVHAALRDGVALDRLAEALDVRPAEVQRMSHEHVLRVSVPGESKC